MERLDNKVLVKTVKGFDIYFTPLVEHIDIKDHFEASDVDEIIKSLNNYETVLFCAKVTAEKNGIELASDYLGVCIYESYEDFYIKYENDYFADMTDTVIKEAKQAIKELLK